MSSSSTGGKSASGEKGSKGEIQCQGCADVLELDHAGIRCPQNHHMCLDTCAPTFATMVLAEPFVQLPVKCPTCRTNISSSIFERVLDDAQREIYLQLLLEFVLAKTLVGPGEILCQCPSCQYFEIRQGSQNDILFVQCNRTGCCKTTCFVCKQEYVPRDEDDRDAAWASDDDEEQEQDDLSRHFKCCELGKFKKMFDDVIASGLTIACPECGIRGMKDDACCHMVCDGCQTEWCYCCGKKDQDLDKEGKNIYSHFEGWDTNVKRCPMYLTHIVEVEQNAAEFSENEDTSLALFHRRRTLCLLHNFIQEISSNRWFELVEHFNSIKNCGFTTNEITQEGLAHRARRRHCADSICEDDLILFYRNL